MTGASTLCCALPQRGWKAFHCHGLSAELLHSSAAACRGSCLKAMSGPWHVERDVVLTAEACRFSRKDSNSPRWLGAFMPLSFQAWFVQ